MDIQRNDKSIKLSSGSLGFTYCQVPCIYHLSDQNQVLLTFSNGDLREINSLILDKDVSNDIFGRSGKIERIDIRVSADKISLDE